jgi:hypothetical protein
MRGVVRGCVGLSAVAVALTSGHARAQSPVVDAPGSEPKVTVILDQPEGATLLRENVVGWGSVCQAPCVARLPRDGVFVINVPGSKKTGELELEDSPAKVRLKLHPPSEGGLIGGTILTYVGGSIAPIGLILLAAGGVTGQTGVLIAGGVVTGIAGIGLGVGIPLIVSNHHTHVEQQPVAQGLRIVGSF